MVQFLGSLRPNHTPAPHIVFSFPLFMQAPSVYILASSYLLFASAFLRHCARLADSHCGSVKIQKHSAMSFLLVMVGSKVIFPFCSIAIWFCSFLLGVSDKSPCPSPRCSRFVLGVSACSLISASVAHLCRCVQFLLLSSVQSWHPQKFDVLCGWSCSLSLAVVFVRSTTVSIWCFCIRHFVVLVFINQGIAPVWNHAGSSCFRAGDSLIAAKLALWVCAAWSILDTFLFSLAAHCPLVGGFQDCRNVLILACVQKFCRAMSLISMSAILAQVGLVEEKFR